MLWQKLDHPSERAYWHGGSRSISIAQAIEDPQGSVLGGGWNPASRANRRDKPIFNFASSEPEGREIRSRLGEYFAVANGFVSRSETTCRSFLANSVPDVQEGQVRSEETSVDPAIPTFRRECWAFDLCCRS